jgi:hypothetical protein
MSNVKSIINSATRSATIVNADRAILIATDKLTKGFDLSHDIYNINGSIENNIYSDILFAINQELLDV